MKTLFILLFSLGLFSLTNAQIQNKGEFCPDSLEIVTVAGTAIVQDSLTHSKYFIDTNNDGTPDYILNFGPFWYQPDSSDAVKPLNGESISITGGKHESLNSALSVIVVYEINGNFWRDPYDPFWNNFGGHNHGGGRFHGGAHGVAYGWHHKSLDFITLSGTAIVDTTFKMNLYFIDTNNDQLPDYFLNFGPYWFEPESGAVRPLNGESITINGGIYDDSDSIPIVIVFNVNGLNWRDSSKFGNNFGGGWMHKNMNSSLGVHNPYDDSDFFNVNPGWHNGHGNGGGMMQPDSFFCQMLELYPQNIPNAQNQNRFAGFELGIYSPNGQNSMGNGGKGGGHMNFNSSVKYQFHFSNKQLELYGINKNSVQAKYWDDQTSSWVTVSDAVLDVSNNTISFSSTSVNNYVILTGESTTQIEQSGVTSSPSDFQLNQNYPNPFNPSTTINFSLAKDVHVILSVYNALGQKVAEIINRNMDAGNHSINFNASNLSSGIYFYELNTGSVNLVKKMNLLK